MPSRFEKYRFTKKTVLSDETFNRIWQDIDVRIAALEDTQKDWEGAVRQLTEHGLRRIEEVLRPSYEHMQNRRQQADELVGQIHALRQNADSMINARRDEVLQQITATRDQALADISTARNQALAEISASMNQALVVAFFFGGD